MDGAPWRVVCIMSDGEMQEGQTWEALMFAGNRNLNNLTAIIDRNNIQIDGFTEEVMPIEPLGDKLTAFGWTVLEIDGHNIEEIYNAVEKARAIFENPTAIVAHTVPGKGVEFMEGDYKWHGVPPNKEQAGEALKELRTLWGKIQGE
jgi:transketolase